MAMSNKITFNDAQKEQIGQALTDFLFMKDEAAKGTCRICLKI
jgi:hypothetical protein